MFGKWSRKWRWSGLVNKRLSWRKDVLMVVNGTQIFKKAFVETLTMQMMTMRQLSSLHFKYSYCLHTNTPKSYDCYIFICILYLFVNIYVCNICISVWMIVTCIFFVLLLVYLYLYHLFRHLVIHSFAHSITHPSFFLDCQSVSTSSIYSLRY